MKWQNRVQLIGYLGKDPDVKILPSGFYYATMRLATNNGFSNQQKDRQTMWHTVKIWGKRSNYIQNFFMKGSHVLVDGKIVYRSYLDKEGNTRFVTEIKAQKIMNLDR
ncbi:MAG: single-stranded DNA-binding protein [Chitinophagaceae bacterium]|jgi:single-strand DNA-binding protein